MNKRDTYNVASTANGILHLWRLLIEEGKAQEPDAHHRCWYRRAEMQAYQDALNCMKYNGLIEDYDVEKIQVRLGGVWTDQIKQVKA